MAKQNQSPFREICTEIRKGNYAPIYLLMGQEYYFIDTISDLLQEYVVPIDERDFNQTILYGQDTTIESVVNIARQYPVMAQRQIVFLKEAQTMSDSKRQLEKLLTYASNPSLSTTLVITYKDDVINANSKLIKAITQSGGVIFNSPKLRDWQLDQHIKEYCIDKNYKIDNKSVAILKEFIGADLKRLFSEIDKLVIGLPEGNSIITPELIERNIGFSKDFNNFELIKAIVTRNYPKSMHIINYFQNNPKQNPTIVTTTIIFNLFSNILLAHYSNDKSDRGLMEKLGLRNSYGLEDIKNGASSFTARSTIAIISAIREMDCKSKGINSTQKDYNLLKELIYKIFTL